MAKIKEAAEKLLPKVTEAEKEKRKELVKRIRQLCDEQNISMRELERINGLSNALVSKWEHSSASYSSLLRIANYFNVSIYYLLGEEDSKLNNEQHLVAEMKNDYQTETSQKTKQRFDIDIMISHVLALIEDDSVHLYAKNKRLTKKELSVIKKQLEQMLNQD